MLTLWALAIMLASQAKALDLLSPPPMLEKLPVNKPPPLRRNFLNYPAIPRTSFTIESQPQPEKRGCYPVARYFLSSSKLDDYLNAILPPQIEQMLMCKEVDLAGLLGTVLSKVLDTVSDLDLLSLLNITPSLDILGGGGLGGILSKGSSSKSSKLPLSPLLEATGVSNLLSGDQGTLQSLVPTNTEKGPDNKPSPVSNLLRPLSDVVSKVGKLTESTEGVLESVIPAGTKNGLLGELGNLNLKDLLVGLEVQKVTVENMMSTMTDDGILVRATTTTFIVGKGLLGPVLNLLGFQVNGDVTLKIGISTNTHCTSFQVQDKDMEVKQVKLQLVETVTDILPLPISLPLDDIITELLTVDLKENIKKSKSCDIDLSDSNECKHSTGLFEYQFEDLQMSAEGLSILYCASSNKITSISGSPLPPVPTDANVSITLSRTMVRAIVSHSAKQSSIQMKNLDTHITRVVYFSQPGNQVQSTYWVNVNKDAKSFGTGQTKITISYECKILKGKLQTDIKIVSFEHSMIPPEAMAEVQDLMSAVMKKFVSTITELFNQWNIPPGITSNPLTNAKVKLLEMNDLQATN